MRKFMRLAASLLAASVLFTGCNAGSGGHGGWYEEIVDFYQDGYTTHDWSEETTLIYASPEQKTALYNFGYLATDIDGDGTDEFLVGRLNTSPTMFTNLYIWHNDLHEGTCLLGGTIYLCGDNLIRMDQGDGTTVYYSFNSSSNSFSYRTDVTNAQPMSYTLTPFDVT